MYFDSAATTFQKPPSVAEAMQDALQTMSSPGRGGHSAAMRAADTESANNMARLTGGLNLGGMF